MKTLTKVALGCGIVLVLGGAAAVALLVGGAYWVKGKVEQVTTHESRIDTLKKKAAAAAPFTKPADNVVEEPRLLKFLEIRKGMHSLFERHRPEIERIQKAEKADLRDAWNALSWINDLRLAHAQAQAEVGMGDEEYRFLMGQVYRIWLAVPDAPSPTPDSVPPANLELFKKHQAAIDTYAMSGLAIFGL